MDIKDLQQTFADQVTFTGTGLHTGVPASMVCRPAPPGTGIVFCRVDLPGSPSVPATIGNVVEVLRGTTLAVGAARVHTVEHVMAALYGLGIDNALIELSGEEPPAMDGSALPFVEAFSRVGVVPQDAERLQCNLREVMWLEDGDRSIVYRPSDRFEVSFTLEYPRGLIPRQTFHAVIDQEFFTNTLCRARTFGFTFEFDMLKERNLALGGSLNNAVVIRDDGTVMNESGLRDPQEFVLHKILDLVGDLALIGRRLRGHILAHKTGHAYNVRFAQRLCERHRSLYQRKEKEPVMMNIEEIKSILPHRYPFLLVDKILSMEPGKSAIGIKNVTANEPFFQGHFPARAVMPGVLIVEAMAQVAGVLFLSLPEHQGKLPFFCGIDKVRFRRPVVPGDRLEFKVETLKVRGNTGKVAVEARVDGDLVTAGELMFTII